MQRAFTLLLAAFSAALLAAGYLNHALVAAGGYATRPDVRIPVAVILALIYSGPLAAMLFLRRKIPRLSANKFAFPFAALLIVATGAALWLAPLVPFFSLILLCQLQATCPNAANPISWAFLGLIGPRELPFSPFWIVAATALVALLTQKIPSCRERET
jgi:hypothetical protein